MNQLKEWKDLTFNSLNEMALGIVDAIPNILGALLILILGWIITKIIVYVLKKILKTIKIDRLTELLNKNKAFGSSNFKFSVTNVIVGFVKWIMFLVFLIVAADIMQWEIVSIEIGKLLGYLPKLFSAIALFLIGIYIADYIRKAISGILNSLTIGSAKIVSNVIFYAIAIIITVTALSQAGVDTTILTSNLSIILGAVLLTFTLALGLGSRPIVEKLLSGFYARKNFKIGQRITFGEHTGTIEGINNISLKLKTDGDTIVIPINDVVTNEIKIVE